MPSIYLIARRWDNPADDKVKEIPRILHDMCEKYGYPESQEHDSWKRRRWASFFKNNNDPRGIASVSTGMELNREHDKYPVFSRFLIELLYVLYIIWIQKGDSDKTTLYCDQLNKIINENFADNYQIDWLFTRETKVEAVKENITTLIKIMKEKDSLYYHNGLIPVVKYIFYNIDS